MAKKKLQQSVRPWLLDLVVGEISQGIEPCTEAVNGAFESLADQATNTPPGLDAWHRYYTDQWSLVSDMAFGLGVSADAWSTAEEFINKLQNGDVVPELAVFYLAMLLPSDVTGKQFDGDQAGTIAILLERIKGIRSEVVGACDEESMASLMATRAAGYFFHVGMPSVILYGKTPRQLLYEAIKPGKPDFAALEALFRLDRRALHHPLVKRFLHRLPDGIPEDGWLLIANALSAGRRSMTASQVAVFLARLVKDVAGLFGVKLHDKDVKEAFDAAVRREGKTAQLNWPTSLDAARKAISRARTFEGLPPAVDKKASEVVRTLCERFS